MAVQNLRRRFPAIRRHHHRGGNPIAAYVALAATSFQWHRNTSLIGTGNGASVASWTDEGTGAHTIITDTVAPTWDTGVLGGSVQFVAANTQALTNATSNMVDSIAGCTAWMVGRYDAIVGFQWCYGNGNRFAVSGSGSTLSTSVNTANHGDVTFSDTTNAHVFEYVYDGSQNPTNANALKVLIDGTQQALSFSGTIPATFATATQFTLGRETATASQWATAHIAEFLAWKSTQSVSDRSTIRQGLGAKYGITVIP